MPAELRDTEIAYRQATLRAAAQACSVGPGRRLTMRERLAATLIVIAAWLAPARGHRLTYYRQLLDLEA